jgi:anaerobic magnesium-protoporphyrin IX monomethyl ester cyclase
MSADVLFGQAYFLRFDAKLWAAQQPYAPLGTLYAAAVARQRGWSVALFDAMLANSVGDWETALDRHRPSIAVLYEDSFNYLSKMCLLRMREAALEMIAAARARRITTIVAGSDASDHAALYLDAGAACVIAGEGEVTLTHVLDTLQGRSPVPLEQIDGLVFRGDDGVVRRTPARAFVRDLDDLPRPAWDLVDVARYRDIWQRRHGFFSMNVATTRGCPFHCNWCAKPIYGQRYTSRQVSAVVAEIAWLKATYRPDHLWIADDIFGLKPGWIEEFARQVVAAGAVVPFKCLLRADGVTAAIAASLARAGCRTVWIGAESGAQRILDAMDKGTTVDDIGNATAHLRAHGIEVGFFLQFGYPGETFADIEATLRMVRAYRPDDIGVSVSYPLPGTTFFDRVKAQLGTKRNWVDSNDLALMYRGTYPPAFYRALHQLVHTEFRQRRAWDTLRRVARRPRSLSWATLRLLMSGIVSAARRPIRLARVLKLAQAPEAVPVQAEHGPTLVQSRADVGP